LKRITENIVKKVALRFFRAYYKNRVRDERFPVEAKYDLEAAGGIIADGYYSYTPAKGKRFVATFEATALENKDEVLFKPQWKLMLWDGLAVSSILVLFLSVLNYAYQWQQLAPGNVLSRIGLFLLATAISLGVFVFIARQFVRYRYIYAIEQFKKYYADEQWIAIAEDVFDSPTDPAFVELKRQCVLNGIGLLSVDEQLEVKVLITPSRHDLFQGKRKPLSFAEKETAAQGKRASEGWWSAFGFRLPARAKGKKSIYRYRKSFTAQIAISVGALFIAAVVHLQEWKRAPVQRISKEKFRNEVALSESNKRPEQQSYLVDTLPEKILAPKDDWFLPPISDVPSSVPSEIDLSKYPCERYNNFNSAQYIIEMGTLVSEDDARDLASEYAHRGVDVTILPWGCFGHHGGYVMFTGFIYGSAQEAKIILDDLRKKHPSLAKEWKVRELAPISS
jgi:hypothetical protein